MSPHYGNSSHGAGPCWQGNIAVHMHIAPFLDAANLFRAFNFGAAYMDPPECSQNLTVNMVRSAIFVCPSEAKDPRNVPINNYRYNIGVTICQATAWFDTGVALNPWTANCRGEVEGRRGGMFKEEGVFSTASVPDGLSNTAMFSERIVGDSDDRRIGLGDVRSGPAMRDPSLTTDFMVAQCERNGPSVPDHTSNFGVGAGSQTSGDLHATIYNHLFAPNSRTIDCHSGQGRIDSPNESAVVTARSYHPGGVNVLTGDGAVRFVKDEREPRNLAGPRDAGGRRSRLRGRLLIGGNRVVSYGY